MLTIVSYFLCHIKSLKHEENCFPDVLPSGNRPAGKETLRHKMFGTVSVPFEVRKWRNLSRLHSRHVDFYLLCGDRKEVS